jgi:hypothetical protein
MEASQEAVLSSKSPQVKTVDSAECREGLQLSRQLALSLLKHGNGSIRYIAREITHVLETAIKGVIIFWEQHKERLQWWPASAVAALRILLQRMLASTAMRKLISIVAQLACVKLTLTTNDDLTDSSSKASARITTCFSLLFGAIR